jgi:hypothetical protein
MYSKFVTLARAGVVKSALIDEGTSTLHFSVCTDKVQELVNQKKWYQRFLGKSTSPSVAQAPTLRQYSTRVIGRDTSFVQVCFSTNS